VKESKIEGLVVSKVQYKERDLICHLLKRDGVLCSVLFPGGRGGGKKKKGTIIELGFMLSVELLKKIDDSHADLVKAKEWSLIWSHEKIRENYQAYLLLCHYAHIANEMSSGKDEQFFGVIANAIAHLEESIQSNSFEYENELFLFHTKLLVVLGIFPAIDHCLYCEGTLDSRSVLSLEQGSFICINCAGLSEELSIGKPLLELLLKVIKSKYLQLKEPLDVVPQQNKILMQYISQQLHLSSELFRILKSF